MSKYSVNNWRHYFQSLSKRLEEFQKLTSQLSKHSHEMDQWLQMLTHFSHATLDQEKRKKINESLAKKNQDNPQRTGDMIYDLFTSPNMIHIVKETMKKKNK